MDLENYNEAINFFLKAIETNNEIYGSKKDGFFNVAYCFLHLENFDKARKYLNLSQKINENKIKNYFKNGVSACEEKGIGAQEYLLEFSKIYNELKKKFIDINYYLGICNIELNNYEEAINNFNLCNKYDNKFGDGYYYKGIAYSKLKRYQKSIEQYKKAIECDDIPIYRIALKNEENKINFLFNNIETAIIDLTENKETNLNVSKKEIQINSNIMNKMNSNRLNKSVNAKNKNNNINRNSFNKTSIKNRINIFKNKNQSSMSFSKYKKIRQIDLSKSSKELIKINLKDKKSNFEKNEKIREIIKNNISCSKKRQKNISKNFYKKYITSKE